MKRILILLAALPLLFSCNTEPEETTGDNSTTENISVENEFDIFFQRFVEDPAFQIESVKFPYRVELWEPGEEKPEVETLYKDEWEHINLQYDSSFATRKTDAYTQEIITINDTVKVQLRGVDNGIAVDYEFVKINGSWALVAEKDFSN